MRELAVPRVFREGVPASVSHAIAPSSRGGLPSSLGAIVMRGVALILSIAAGCATPLPANLTARDAESARGPWSDVASVEMPTGDASVPSSLLRDVADALLGLPGARCVIRSRGDLSWESPRSIARRSTSQGARTRCHGVSANPCGEDTSRVRLFSASRMRIIHPPRPGSLGTSTTTLAVHRLPRMTSAPDPRMYSSPTWPWCRSD